MKMELIKPDGSPLIAPSPARGSGVVPMPSAEFMRGSKGGPGHVPATLRSIQEDVEEGWGHATAQATDLVQNSGWISGMFDQAVANTVGVGLRLSARPDESLFSSPKASKEWRNLVETRWRLYSENAVECDIAGRKTIPQMQEAAFRGFLTTGESFAELVWKRRFGSAHGTKVRLLPSTRLSMQSDDLRRIKNGVQMDRDGFPIGYLARRDSRFLGENDHLVRARDKFGRPRVIHTFVGQAEQVRGITPLVPVIKVARQFDQLADSTLLAALIQTVFAANVQSDAPTEEALEGLLTPQEQAKLMAAGISPFAAWSEMQSGWYDNNMIDVGIAGRVTTTFPGQKLEFLSPEHPTSSYRDFAMHLLREMARCLGMTYESATGDYSGATYSSVRMAVNEIFQITLARRKFVVAPFTQPIYEAWLEEEIASNRIPFPGGYVGFLVNRMAACRAMWIGSPKPQADELKAAKAHQVYREMGVITDEMIASDLGVDISDVYAQREREMELRSDHGLPEPASGPEIKDEELEDEEGNKKNA